MIPVPEINLGGILPALVLCLAGLVVLVACLFVPRGKLTCGAIISLVGIIIAFMANGHLRYLNEKAFSGLVVLDAYGWYLNILILLAAALTILISIRYLADEGLHLYEYFVLLLFASAGMMFMVSANHLLMIFVGLETLSISIYILAGVRPGKPESKEAALKYLLLGAFASGIFLYGAALLYGSASSLSLPVLANYCRGGHMSLMAKAGMGLVLVGFAFKVAAVPFHMWTPDVY